MAEHRLSGRRLDDSFARWAVRRTRSRVSRSGRAARRLSSGQAVEGRRGGIVGRQVHDQPLGPGVGQVKGLVGQPQLTQLGMDQPLLAGVPGDRPGRLQPVDGRGAGGAAQLGDELGHERVDLRDFHLDAREPFVGDLLPVRVGAAGSDIGQRVPDEVGRPGIEEAEGRLLDPDGPNGAAKTLLGQLTWWARALRAARSARPYGIAG